MCIGSPRAPPPPVSPCDDITSWPGVCFTQSPSSLPGILLPATLRQDALKTRTSLVEVDGGAAVPDRWDLSFWFKEQGPQLSGRACALNVKGIRINPWQLQLKRFSNGT